MKPYVPNKLPMGNLDWTAFISYIGPANAALARYDGILQAILNPDVLLSPLTTQEAVLSSKIEGTQADIDEVFLFEGAGEEPEEGSKKVDIQEIINYRVALRYAVDELKSKPMNLNLLNQMHYVLLDSVRGADKSRGEFRMTQNWIGKRGAPIEQAKFIPPEPLMVKDWMSNLEKYIHFEEKDFLVQMAVIHAQFELIHPYIDGNGRLGRIMIPLVLYGNNLLSSPMFYLSSYLEKNREEYYERLNSISRKDDWTGWILFFLKAVIQQAKDNTKKAKAILDLYEIKKKKISDITNSKYAIQTVDCLFKTPVFTATKFTVDSGVPKASAARILQQLVDNEILLKLKPASGRTPARYIFLKLMNIVRE